MSKSRLVVLANPAGKTSEQLAVLESLPIGMFGQCSLVSTSLDIKVASGIELILVKRAIPSVIWLRGLIAPLLPYARFSHQNARNILLIHDELFSSTMIHAVIARIFYGYQIAVICAENQTISKIHEIVARFFSRFVDLALCTSSETMTLVRDLGIEHAFFCPVPVINAGPQPRKPAGSIREIGFVGRLEPKKGIKIYCEAARQISGVRFHAFGKGSFEPQLIQYPVRHGGSFDYTREALDQVFSGLDLLAVPSLTTKSWKEQFGRVIVEAMDRGVLVIGSNSGAIPEVIGEPELIFDENSVDALVSKIEEIRRKSPAEIAELRVRLKDRFERNFSASAIARIIQSAFSTVFRFN